MAPATKDRALILVKAYPQPSQKYEETVCCAGINEHGHFVRLYPIRYRHLAPEQKFDRWDIIEFEAIRPMDDWRPESRHVNEASICIVQRKERVSELQRFRLWAPHVAQSLVALRQENVDTEKSLGIIKPDPGSVTFHAVPMKADSADDRELQDAFRQISLLDSDPLPELTIDYKFEYRFTCDGQKHEMKIHDWEVQAAYHHFKRRYGNGALEMLKAEYQTNIPARHLHLVMGTMKAHPRQFIIIGLLRSNLNPADALRQPTLLP